MTPLPVAVTAHLYDEYDCLRCGACCVSDFEERTYVYLNAEDVDRLEENERRKLLVFDDERQMWATMRTVRDSRGDCRCSALGGRVGEHVSCSLYERRPHACRKFEPGSMECDYARRQILGISDK